MADTKSDFTNDRQAVFTYLMNCRSMVKSSNYAVLGGVVSFDHVVVHEATPKATTEILRTFKMVGLYPDGLLIPLTPDPK